MAYSLKLSGITPARAGKRAPENQEHPRTWNYPRSRGEESVRFATAQVARGITPARAGKRGLLLQRRVPQRNYPRSRGEEHSWLLAGFATVELPPLARGRVPRITSFWIQTGITPARAGKRPTPKISASSERNYPRSRGEEYPAMNTMSWLPELPPLARGRECLEDDEEMTAGITPARAGKSGFHAR